MSRIEYWDTTQGNKVEMMRFLRKTEMEGIGVVQRLKYENRAFSVQ